LREFENKVIADALSTITRDQERINALSAAQRYERWKAFIASTHVITTARASSLAVAEMV
jgi:hypothetical protein